MPADQHIPLLRARHLTAVFAGDAGPVSVLDGVSLDLFGGEVVDVVGPSGSGKSTLVRVLARLLPGATGELVLQGRPAASYTPPAWRREVALLPQKPFSGNGSIREELTLPWRLKVRAHEAAPDEGRLREVLDVLGMTEVSLDREAVRLSVGQQGRLAFARVWLTSPSVLLLDEADAALDDESARGMAAAVRRFVSEGDRAVLRVRHRVDDGVARRRLHLEGGRLEEERRS